MAEQGPNQFELARKRAKQAANTATQKRQEALKRRFAAAGGLSSGAFIKQSQIAQKEGAKQYAQSLEGIDAAQAQEMQRRREIKEGREFSRGEREASQQFAAGQAGLQREFASGESAKGRQFTAGQSALQRKFLTGERQAGQLFSAEQAGLQRKFSSGEAAKQRQFVSGERQASQSFAASQQQLQREFQSDESRKNRLFQAAENDEQRKMIWNQFNKSQQFKEKVFYREGEQFKQNMDFAYKQFIEEKRINDANLETARQAANEKGLLEGWGETISSWFD